MVDRDLRLRHEDIVGTVAAGRQRLGIQEASTERMQTHRRDETWSKVKQIHQIAPCVETEELFTTHPYSIHHCPSTG